MAKKLRLLVLYGGRSAEHEISIESAETVIGGLDRKKYQVLPLFIDRRGRWCLHSRLEKTAAGGMPVTLGGEAVLHSGRRKIRFDAAFPVLHGPFGEDGSVQGVLESAGAPYVGSGVLGSAIGMDKELSKELAANAGLAVPAHVVARRGDAPAPLLRRARRLGLPVFVKPNGLGSSVGVRRVGRWKDLGAAVRYALRFDRKALIERGVEGAEVAVAVLGDERRAETTVVGAIRPTPRHAFFSYRSKYLDDHGFDFVIPAELPAKTAREVRRQAAVAFRALQAHGMARVDFLLDRRNRPFFGEINTIPGFTGHSLYPKLWQRCGVPLPKLLDRLMELAFERARAESRLRAAP